MPQKAGKEGSRSARTLFLTPQREVLGYLNCRHPAELQMLGLGAWLNHNCFLQ